MRPVRWRAPLPPGDGDRASPAVDPSSHPRPAPLPRRRPVRTDNTTIEVRQSTDSGAAFGASAVVATAGGTVTAVACAVRADGSAAVVWATGGVVYSSRRTGTGAWGAPAAWSPSLASVSAIAMTDASDYAVLVSGADASGAQGVWSTRLRSGQSGPPGVWLPLTEVAAAAAGTGEVPHAHRAERGRERGVRIRYGPCDRLAARGRCTRGGGVGALLRRGDRRR